jgi:pSer/pThr/pTyr-binding forkhead associated (FHA) protein
MKKLTKKLTIGRHTTNDYSLSERSLKTSRQHANLYIYNDGSMELEDFSSNGTYVNGKPLNNDKVSVYQGDIISFANEEKLDWTKIGKTKSKFPLWAIIIPILLLLAGIGYTLFMNQNKKMTIKEIRTKYDKSIGLIANAYLLRTVVGESQLYVGYDKELYEKDQTLKESFNVDQNKLIPFFITGTGFLIEPISNQDNANLATNRHVVNPAWQINNQQYSSLEEQEFFSEISKSADDYEAEYRLKRNPNRKYETHSRIIRFIPSDYKFAFNQGMSYSEFLNQLGSSNAQPSRWSKDQSIDIAVLSCQLDQNDRYYISLTNDFENDLNKVEVGDETTILGYSGGMASGFEIDKSIIEYQTSSRSISKTPSEFNITYDIPTSGGSSGSPIFDEYGKVIAIHYARQGVKGLGVPIKHLKSVLEFDNTAKKGSNNEIEYK